MYLAGPTLILPSCHASCHTGMQLLPLRETYLASVCCHLPALLFYYDGDALYKIDKSYFFIHPASWWVPPLELYHIAQDGWLQEIDGRVIWVVGGLWDWPQRIRMNASAVSTNWVSLVQFPQLAICIRCRSSNFFIRVRPTCIDKFQLMWDAVTVDDGDSLPTETFPTKIRFLIWRVQIQFLQQKTHNELKKNKEKKNPLIITQSSISSYRPVHNGFSYFTNIIHSHNQSSLKHLHKKFKWEKKKGQIKKGLKVHTPSLRFRPKLPSESKGGQKNCNKKCPSQLISQGWTAELTYGMMVFGPFCYPTLNQGCRFCQCRSSPFGNQSPCCQLDFACAFGPV